MSENFPELAPVSLDEKVSKQLLDAAEDSLLVLEENFDEALEYLFKKKEFKYIISSFNDAIKIFHKDKISVETEQVFKDIFMDSIVLRFKSSVEKILKKDKKL